MHLIRVKYAQPEVSVSMPAYLQTSNAVERACGQAMERKVLAIIHGNPFDWFQGRYSCLGRVWYVSRRLLNNPEVMVSMLIQMVEGTHEGSCNLCTALPSPDALPPNAHRKYVHLGPYHMVRPKVTTAAETCRELQSTSVQLVTLGGELLTNVPISEKTYREDK